ncbi:hypothetical protein ABGN05_22665 [Aquibium sp. LZ166]|uniref:Uncharacterized protein n=1 Tax=Aquibium pacificus TaxID=3153579 RepID=A0ABV3SNV1_9HYPH
MTAQVLVENWQGDGRIPTCGREPGGRAPGGGNLIVDFVGLFERLENDLNAALADRIGRRLDLKRVNASKHAHYSTYYSSELAEEVGRRCRQDVEAFGYRFERP